MYSRWVDPYQSSYFGSKKHTLLEFTLFAVEFARLNAYRVAPKYKNK